MDRPAIWEAIECGDLWRMNQFLLAGEQVNCTSSGAVTPLHHFAKTGNLPGFRLLVEHGANLQLTDDRNDTVLHYACRYSQYDIVTFLIGKVIDPILSSLEPKNWVETERNYAVEFYGCRLINSIGDCNKTPLLLAVENGSFDIAQLLLRKDADINIVDSSDQSVITLAIQQDRQDLRDLLLRHGPVQYISVMLMIRYPQEAPRIPGDNLLDDLPHEDQVKVLEELCKKGAVDVLNKLLKEKTVPLRMVDVRDILEALSRYCISQTPIDIVDCLLKERLVFSGRVWFLKDLVRAGNLQLNANLFKYIGSKPWDNSKLMIMIMKAIFNSDNCATVKCLMDTLDACFSHNLNLHRSMAVFLSSPKHLQGAVTLCSRLVDCEQFRNQPFNSPIIAIAFFTGGLNIVQALVNDRHSFQNEDFVGLFAIFSWASQYHVVAEVLKLTKLTCQSDYTYLKKQMISVALCVNSPRKSKQLLSLINECEMPTQTSNSCQLITTHRAINTSKIEKSYTFLSEQSKTPLHLAIESGHIELVKLFVEDLGDESELLLTPEVLKNIPILLFLLSHSGKTRDIPMLSLLVCLAAAHKYTESMNRMLHLGSGISVCNIREGLQGLYPSTYSTAALHFYKQCLCISQASTSASEPLYTSESDLLKRLFPNRDSLSEVLEHACRENDLKTAKLCIANGASINATALHITCAEGYFDLAEMLIKAGADVNCKMSAVVTPLHECIVTNHVELCKLLLAQDEIIVSDFAVINGQIVTPLHLAVQQKNVEILQLLLEHCANVNTMNEVGETILYEFLEFRSPCKKVVKMFKLLLQHGAYMDEKYALDLTDRAIEKKSFATIACLLDTGHLVQPVNLSRMLYMATITESAQTMLMLLDASSQVDSPSDIIEYFHYNVNIDDEDEVCEIVHKVFSRMPFKLSGLNSCGQALWRYCAKKNFVGLAHILVTYGMQVESAVVAKSYQTSALQVAVTCDHLNMVFFLLRELKNSNTLSKDNNILHSIVEQFSTLKRLENYISTYDSGIDTPHRKPSYEPALLKETMSLLLDQGDYINAKDIDGKYPIHYALQNNNSDICKYLLEKGHRGEDHEKQMSIVLNQAITNFDLEMIHAVSSTEGFEENGYDLLMNLLKHVSCVKRQDIMDNVCTNLEWVMKKLLLQKYTAWQYGSLLNYAVTCGSLHLVSMIIGTNWCDVDQRKCKPDRFVATFTPLQLSLQYGNFPIANMLIQNGASVSVLDKDNNTLLHLIQQCKASPNHGVNGTVSLLVKCGLSVDAVNVHRQTPLEMPGIREDGELVKLLLRSGSQGKMSLHSAMKCGPDIFYIYLNRNWSSSENGDQCRNILHQMCKSYCPDTLITLIKMAIDRGANVNARDEYGRVPLHFACESRKYDIIKLLIEHGGDVDVSDSSGENVLCCLFDGMDELQGSDLIFRTLLEKVANPKEVLESTLNMTYRHYQYRIGRCFDNYTRSICMQSTDFFILCKEYEVSFNRTNRLSETASHIMCWMANEISPINVSLLCTQENVNAIDCKGNTPLHVAVSYGKAGMIRPLIQHGAKLDILNLAGFTSLELCIIKLNVDSLKVLLDTTDCVNLITFKDGRGLTPLIFSMINDDEYNNDYINPINDGNSKWEMMETLFEYGADPNIPIIIRFSMCEWSDDSALHVAVRNKSLPQMRLLLEHGADISTRNHRRQSAMELCVDRDGECDVDTLDLWELLLKAGADMPHLYLVGLDKVKEFSLWNNLAQLLLNSGCEILLPSHLENVSRSLTELINEHSSRIATLQQLACNTVRKNLYPNALCSVEKLGLPKLIEDLVMFNDIKCFKVYTDKKFTVQPNVFHDHDSPIHDHFYPIYDPYYPIYDEESSWDSLDETDYYSM